MVAQTEQSEFGGRFGGRSVIVTGSAQGLGRAITLRLLAEGAKVLAVDIQAAKLEAFCKSRPESQDGRLVAAPLNLATESGGADMAFIAMETFGQIDALLNVAGGSGDELVREIEEVREEIWQYSFTHNTHATFRCCRAVVPHMRARGYGRIVNFSTGATIGTTMWPTTIAARLAYVASKGAIEAFSRQLALDLAPVGISVNVLSPGFVLTEPGARVYERFQTLPPEVRKAFSQTETSSRTKPEDIAEAAAFLASEAAGEVNGIVLKVGC